MRWGTACESERALNHIRYRPPSRTTQGRPMASSPTGGLSTHMWLPVQTMPSRDSTHLRELFECGTLWAFGVVERHDQYHMRRRPPSTRTHGAVCENGSWSIRSSTG